MAMEHGASFRGVFESLLLLGEKASIDAVWKLASATQSNPQAGHISPPLPASPASLLA